MADSGPRPYLELGRPGGRSVSRRLVARVPQRLELSGLPGAPFPQGAQRELDVFVVSLLVEELIDHGPKDVRGRRPPFIKEDERLDNVVLGPREADVDLLGSRLRELVL